MRARLRRALISVLSRSVFSVTTQCHVANPRGYRYLRSSPVDFTAERLGHPFSSHSQVVVGSRTPHARARSYVCTHGIIDIQGNISRTRAAFNGSVQVCNLDISGA